MPTRINRLLIPLVLVILISLGSNSQSSGRATDSSIYFPLISYDPAGWIGPYGGTITAIVVDRFNSQVIYAGTFGSGVFKSTDGGQSWSSASQGLSNLEIQSLAIDPTNPSTLYAGTYKSQVFKSTDGGKTWSWSGTGMQAEAIVYSIAVDPFTPSTVFASTRGVSNNGNPPWNGIIYKSTNGGQTWTPSLANVGGPTDQDWAYSLCINPNNHDQVFAALHTSGPYLLNDSGWHWIPDGTNDQSGRSIVISPQPEFSSRLYLGVWHDDVIYKTLNSGSLWTGANHDLVNVQVYDLALDPNLVDTVYMATFTGGIYKTTDAGDNWLYAGLFMDKLYSVVINPAMTNNLFAGTAGDGLYRSMNFSDSWERSDTGINNAMVTSVIQHPYDSNRIYSSVYGAGVYQSVNRGQTWESINTGLDDYFVHDLVIDPNNPEILYALTDTAGLFKNDLTTGSGWVTTGMGLPLTDYPIAAFSADDPMATLDMQENFATPQTAESVNRLIKVGLFTMVYAPSNSQIVYIGTVGKGVFRSTDSGSSWLPSGLSGNNIRSLAVDPTNPDLVYATTDYYGSLKISPDGGISWKDANLSANFYSVATSPFESGIVYAGTNIGIYRYDYKSSTWSALGLSDQTVTAVAADLNHPGVLYAGTSTGAYYSKDNGVTWDFVDSRLSGQTILSISFDRAIPEFIYFSTKTHGIFLASIRK